MNASEPVLDYCLPDSVAVWLDSPMEEGVPGSLSIWSSRSIRALIAFGSSAFVVAWRMP